VSVCTSCEIERIRTPGGEDFQIGGVEQFGNPDEWQEKCRDFVEENL
jgi:hypothetical protein